MRSGVRAWSVGHLVVVPRRFVVGGDMEDAGSGLDSGSGWRGRKLKGKADGWMGTDGPSALNRIKWQTDETQQELGSQAVQVCRGPAGWQADGDGG